MVFQDLLTNKDDYLRASRALLREIIKQTKHEINFQSFCFGLMQERKEASYVEMEFKVNMRINICLSWVFYMLHLHAALNCKSLFLPKERFVIQVTDLLTVSMMLGITAQVKEAGIAWDKGEKKSEWWTCFNCIFIKFIHIHSLCCVRCLFLRSGGPEVIPESDSCHPERCCVVASHSGSDHQQSWCKRLCSLVSVWTHPFWLLDSQIRPVCINNLVLLMSAAFTKCFSLSNLKRTTSGTTGLPRATESEFSSSCWK